MKTQQIFVTIGIAAIVCLCFMAFKPTNEVKSYKHIIILTERYDMDQIWISKDGQDYIRQHFQKQSKGKWDFNAVINLINQYENEGYELKEIHPSGFPAESFLFHLQKEN